MANSFFMIIFGFVLFLLVPIGIIFIIYLLIRRLIRYRYELQNGKSKQQSELERMHIDDL